MIDDYDYIKLGTSDFENDHDNVVDSEASNMSIEPPQNEDPRGTKIEHANTIATKEGDIVEPSDNGNGWCRRADQTSAHQSNTKKNFKKNLKKKKSVFCLGTPY